jgi:hypothetical protein
LRIADWRTESKLATRPEEKKSAKSEMFNFIHAANSVCFAY